MRCMAMFQVQMNHNEQLTLETSEQLLAKVVRHRIYKLYIKKYVYTRVHTYT